MLIQLLNQTKAIPSALESRLEIGQGLIEYALIIVVIGSVAFFGVQVEEAYQSITNAFQVGE